ncbi:DUF1671-domain-containing protein [Leucogyrophana mollusca]|uniref:DUF1671-domain-containing protein n=1 Tax=Leucogyrophana mollusca TaxID=85980 RepID=A0ACB8BLV0_9AGAM|nr:DUF1671-domain-containing protein [Leucogyrophana mollusca]
MICQLCNLNIENYSEKDRQEHYDKHYNKNSSHTKPSTSRVVRKTIPDGTSKPPTRMKFPKITNSGGDEFWHPSQARPPPHNFSPGLIPVLKGALKTSHTRGYTCRAVLCFEQTVHISREPFDAGWGCGYRNFLMACTALMVQQNQTIYFPLLDDPMSPGVRNLQLWIEHAWKEGYDEIGARELKHKLHGTKKYIGTGELYVAFTSRGIPCHLVDFDITESPKGTTALTDWVMDYFSPPSPSTRAATVDEILRGATPVVATDKMPLILQHQGHSHTIIGYEVMRNGNVNLLVFDPSYLPNKRLREAGLQGLPLSPCSSPSKPRTRSHVLPSIMHPFSSGLTSTLKRAGRSPSPNASVSKRVRTTSDSDSHDVIIITDSDSEHETQAHSRSKPRPQADNFIDMLKYFRLDNKKLARKNKYQILYFPMDDPWNEKERASRKVVTSTNGY